MNYSKRTLYCGIDVALKINVIALIDNEGKEVIKPFKVSNDQSGAEEIEKKLEEICLNQGFEALKIGTESTSFYDYHLADFLAESEKLAKFETEIYRLNPKITHNFKKTLAELEKTDLVDAQVIAERLRFGRLPCPYHSLKEYFPLQRLTRYRFHLIGNLIREKGFLLSHLFLKYSSFNSKKPIRRILGETSRAIISEYLTPEEIANCPLEKLTALIIKQSKNRYEDSEKIAKKLKQVAKESYRIRASLANSLNLILVSSFRTIRAYQDSLKEIDKAIRDELNGFSQTLTSVPGIGPVFAAGIIAEIGEVTRFKSPDALAKYAGLWWPQNQSGDFKGQDRKLRKSGNKYLRYYLVEAANSLRIHNEEYKAFYQKKYKEVRLHQHKRALVLSAKKLIRLVFSLLKTKQFYRQKRT